MKTIIVFIMFAAFSVGALCQVPQTVALDKLKVTPPQFTGVENAEAFLNNEESRSLADYVAKNFEYPEVRQGDFYEGTELVQFVVSANGEVSDIRVINSVSRTIDEEIIRVLKSTNGMWIPGTSDAKPTAMTRELAVLIKWDETDQDALGREFHKIAQRGFKHAGELWFAKRKPKRALSCYNRCMRYRPNEEALLMMRGLCRYQLGDKEGAREDWCRYRDLGGTIDCEAAWLMAEKKNELKGYEEVVHIMNEKK